jgi:hypothetical protein
MSVVVVQVQLEQVHAVVAAVGGADDGVDVLLGVGAVEAAVAVPEASEEQPVMVATAATPPAGSALFMNQRRLRSASGVRGRCPCIPANLPHQPEPNLKPSPKPRPAA